MNNVRYPRDNTRQIQEIKLQQKKTKKTLKMISCKRYLPTLYRNSPKFSHELWHFTPQVQKRHDYVITRKLQQSCERSRLKKNIN